MKQSEIELYRDLKTPDQAFRNIRKGLGSLRNVNGNPLSKTEIKLHFIINRAGGVWPIQLQFAYPFYIFGLTDHKGSFRKNYDTLPLPSLPAGVINMANPFQTFIEGFVFSGLPDMYYGDMVFRYLFDVGGLLYTFSIRIRCENITYGSLINQLEDNIIFLTGIRYILQPVGIAGNVNQFNNPLTFMYQNMFGKSYTDDLNARAFMSSGDFQNNISDIHVNLPIDKYLSIGSYVNWDVNEFDMILFVEHTKTIKLHE